VIKAIIFDMGETLIRFVRPGSGSWREFETPGIRGIYRYLIEQGHPIASHEDDFVEAMFARLAEGWQQSTGGHISLRAVDWIAAGAADHALTLDEAALIEAARRYALPIRDGLVAADGAAATLAVLRDAGYRIGLISNTIWPAELHMEDLEEIGLLHYEAFRTKQGFILPLVTAIMAVLWGTGFMGVLGQPLDIFNSPTPILILARKDFAPKDLREFVTYAKANVEKLNAAHAGMSRVATTSSASRARHGAPAFQCFVISMRSAVSPL